SVPRIVTASPAHLIGAGGLAIVVVSESRLFAGAGSVTSLPTEAEAVIEPVFLLTAALIVTLRSALVVTVPRSQTILLPVFLQVPPPDAVAVTKETPPGRLVVTLVLVAASGPALWTLIA